MVNKDYYKYDNYALAFIHPHLTVCSCSVVFNRYLTIINSAVMYFIYGNADKLKISMTVIILSWYELALA